jgi:hypothetical protein
MRGAGTRLVLAALLSPVGLFPALAVYMVALVARAGAVDAGRFAAGLGAGLLLAGFGVTFGLLGAVVVLLPGAVLLRALGVASVWTIAGLGLAAGLALAWLEGDGVGFALYGLAGLGVGAAFGLVAGPALRRSLPSARSE